ncbi:MAG: DUF1080 domain-containing protein [Gemmataceae bacterium]|nr:DUF1080 domain-containing protein [Gemmataceae bacterium]MCI0738344.1 DUF1080 domain-containing protein [Gemmataceae bacterium]
MANTPLFPWFSRAVWTAALIALAAASRAGAQEKAWIDLFANGMAAWKTPHGDWQQMESAVLDAKNPRRFEAKPGVGAWYNGPKARTNNLFTKEKFGDVEVELEFMMSKGSNSGIKFHGHYEIQLADSFGKKEVTASDCGGVYPRAEAKPKYHHIDKGIPPKVNACKAPGEWQTLVVVFRAPRFDKDGKKTANARIEKAVLNGQVVHDNQELATPTGDRWRGPEFSEGHFMIQADHGPVALRNVRIRSIQVHP